MRVDLDQTHEAMERAHKRSITVPSSEQAVYVRDVLGSRLAAAALGLKDTRTLSSWASGGPIRGLDSEHRLQVLFRIVTAVAEVFTPAVATAFLRGSNPVLDGRSPLVVLANESPSSAEPKLVAAAESLLSA
jgi:hypothetical protein